MIYRYVPRLHADPQLPSLQVVVELQCFQDTEISSCGCGVRIYTLLRPGGSEFSVLLLSGAHAESCT